MGWQEVHNNRSLLAASVDVINSFTINIDGVVGVNSQYPLKVLNVENDRQPNFSKGLTILAIIMDYERPGMLCLALPARCKA